MERYWAQKGGKCKVKRHPTRTAGNPEWIIRNPRTGCLNKNKQTGNVVFIFLDERRGLHVDQNNKREINKDQSKRCCLQA